MTQGTRGIFIVASGETCRTEARFALERLRRSNPAVPVTVFTDKPGAFDGNASSPVGVEVLESPQFSFIDKIHGFLNAPYDYNIYMDSDTAAVGAIGDLFALLDRFDLAACMGVGAHGRRYNACSRDDIPESFAELNTGVVCFRRSPASRAVFDRWLELYTSHPEHVHDQPAFREAVFESALSLYVLPPEFNYLPGFGVLSGNVRVFHSPRIAADPRAFERFEKQINQSDDVRLFVPPGKLYTLRR
ncbi:MAG: hypothetical protein GF418_09260 [Chitinivibrionales bacterium]|nr:hypothetical protein [Chitinivibrionales bacterium]MBD3395796.1 hypothetical protein [Chitinivibrionales bacterium]